MKKSQDLPAGTGHFFKSYGLTNFYVTTGKELAFNNFVLFILEAMSKSSAGTTIVVPGSGGGGSGGVSSGAGTTRTTNAPKFQSNTLSPQFAFPLQ